MTNKPVSLGTGFHSGNPMVDAIFNQKRALCEAQSIRFSADLVLSEDLPLTDAEMSSLLSNLLNNAIEAAAQGSDPFVEASIYPARDYLCIEVVNGADAQKLKNNPSLNTTKQDPELHGIGIRVIQEIVDRHNGMASFEPDGDGRFRARVMLRL